jgi:hypothetical protein
MLALVAALVLLVLPSLTAAPSTLQVGVKKRPEACPYKSESGDLVWIHYTVWR